MNSKIMKTVAWLAVFVAAAGSTTASDAIKENGDNNLRARILAPNCDKDGDGFTKIGGGCRGTDCDDNDASIYPGAVEVCGNGIDDNCDGIVDEGCSAGTTGTCATGTPNEGTTCTSDSDCGGQCAGGTTPGSSCTIDDDCEPNGGPPGDRGVCEYLVDSCVPSPTTPAPVSPAPSPLPTSAPSNSPTATPVVTPTAAPVTSPPTSPPASASAWINEFHYDNDGTDQGEFIEVAYVGSIDITTYSIVLYNGNGGTSYDTVTIPTGADAGGVSLSVLDFPSNGIQNGSPDGIALVDGMGAVIEFLSYEGTLTATDGPASGLPSNDIGKAESGTTPIGYSLQRGGTGCSAADFTIWADPTVATKGGVNSGQSFSCGPTPAPIPTPFPTSAPTLAPVPTPPTSTTDVKAMTYNILQGGTTTTGWKDIVKTENPDIIVFTEVGNWDDNNDALLNEYLDEFNTYFGAETPYVGSTVQGISYANSANAIMSRFPIVETVQLTDVELSSDSAHDLMVWKLDVGGSKFVYVIGIHLKCCGGTTNDDRRNNTMRNLIAWIDANTNAADGVMLMGDFNAVSPADTDPSFPGYQSGFEPSSGSSLNDGPIRMLLDGADPDASAVHTFEDSFRVVNPTCGSDPDCCADTLCDSGLSTGCPERGYTYVDTSHNYDSRIDFIIINQNVALSPAGAATTGDLGSNVCSASDHLPVDVIVNF